LSPKQFFKILVNPSRRTHNEGAREKPEAKDDAPNM
jgi:hypothetical protein